MTYRAGVRHTLEDNKAWLDGYVLIKNKWWRLTSFISNYLYSLLNELWKQVLISTISHIIIEYLPSMNYNFSYFFLFFLNSTHIIECCATQQKLFIIVWRSIFFFRFTNVRKVLMFSVPLTYIFFSDVFTHKNSEVDY